MSQFILTNVQLSLLLLDLNHFFITLHAYVYYITFIFTCILKLIYYIYILYIDVHMISELTLNNCDAKAKAKA